MLKNINPTTKGGKDFIRDFMWTRDRYRYRTIYTAYRTPSTAKVRAWEAITSGYHYAIDTDDTITGHTAPYVSGKSCTMFSVFHCVKTDRGTYIITKETRDHTYTCEVSQEQYERAHLSYCIHRNPTSYPMGAPQEWYDNYVPQVM